MRSTIRRQGLSRALEGDQWIWDFTIPEGAVALVTLPGESQAHEYRAGSYQIVK